VLLSVIVAALAQDLRFALRTLRKTPGFTIVAAVTLALGIGVNTSIFTLINTFVFRPTRVKDPTSLIRFDSALPHSRYIHYRDGSRSMNLFASNWFLPTLGDEAPVNGEADILHGLETSTNFFTVLGARPVAGRLFLPDDDTAETLPVVVLNDRLWQRRFGRDPNVVGLTIQLDGRAYTVVGVAQPGFDGTLPLAADLWTPLLARQSRSEHYVWLEGRLKSGATLAQAQAEVKVLFERYVQTHPERKREEPPRLMSGGNPRSVHAQPSSPDDDPAHRCGDGPVDRLREPRQSVHGSGSRQAPGDSREAGAGRHARAPGTSTAH
jgi:putative ABC transport system permease protein